jgi:hypothetical protein
MFGLAVAGGMVVSAPMPVAAPLGLVLMSGAGVAAAGGGWVASGVVVVCARAKPGSARLKARTEVTVREVRIIWLLTFVTADQRW